MLLSRPSDSGHTPFGDIFLSESPGLVHWGRHRRVMAKGGSGWWKSVKIGGGAIPIETTGFVPNVIFPCATLQDAETGRIAIYYGAADTYVGVAYAEVDELVNYIKENSELVPGDEIEFK